MKLKAKHFKGTVYVIAALLFLAAVGMFSAWFLGHDNPVEEMAEDQIEQYTGWKFDLSPDSEE